MVFNKEDVILIKSLYFSEGYIWFTQTYAWVQDKVWKRISLDKVGSVG